MDMVEGVNFLKCHHDFELNELILRSWDTQKSKSRKAGSKKSVHNILGKKVFNLNGLG